MGKLRPSREVAQLNGEALTEGSVLTALEELGSAQWGLVTTGQARRIGIERLWLSRLMDRGIIQRIRHGVYALPSATHGPYQELQAAWLITDRNHTLEERVMNDNHVVVSHVSASDLHGLGDLVATRHNFSTSRRRQTAQEDIRFYRRELSPKDVMLKDGLPVTSVPRTISDLADIHIDFDHLAQVTKDALSKGLADFEILASRLDPFTKTYGYDDGNEFMDALIEEAGLPSTTESLLARNLSSALYTTISKMLKDFENPKYLEDLREGLQAALPSLNAANIYETTLSNMLSNIVKRQLPNINISPWTEQLDLSPWTKSITSELLPFPTADPSQVLRVSLQDQSPIEKETQEIEQRDVKETDEP